jgi:phosphohistidine phosphatase SixA
MRRASACAIALIIHLAGCEDLEGIPTGGTGGSTSTTSAGGGSTTSAGGGSTTSAGGGSTTSTGGSTTSAGGSTTSAGGSTTSAGGGSTGGAGATGGSTGGAGGGGTGGSGASGGAAGSTTSTGGSGGQGGAGGAMNLVAEVQGGDVSLAWTPPGSSSEYTGARVLRRLDTPPAAADDPAATLVYEGSSAAALDDLENLLPSTAQSPRTYHYAVFGCDGASCDPNGSFAQVTPTVLVCLRGGGYNVIWRHAAATVCVDDLSLGTAQSPLVPDWWKSCDDVCPPAGTATARQLDATGKMQAPSIGFALEMLGVPFGKVLSSEFCRCKTTAELFDLGPAVQTSPVLTYYVYDEPNRCALTYDLLETKPQPDTNTALVSHAGVTCPILDDLAWGEAAIFKPDGMGGATFITRVLWDAWDNLP